MSEALAERMLLLSLKLLFFVRKRTLLLPLKNKKLTKNIIEDHDDHVRDDLHDQIIYVKLVYKNPQKDRLDHKCGKSCKYKLAKFFSYYLCFPAFAFKDPEFVGHKGYDHSEHPCNNIRRYHVKMEDMSANDINSIIDNGRNPAEKQIQQDFFIFIPERFQFFQLTICKTQSLAA